MRKTILAVAVSAILIPTVALCWGNIKSIWGAPEKIKTVEQAVVQQAETQEAVKDLVVEQKIANERQEAELASQKAITAAQIEALKEIVAAMRKR